MRARAGYRRELVAQSPLRWYPRSMIGIGGTMAARCVWRVKRRSADAASRRSGFKCLDVCVVAEAAVDAARCKPAYRVAFEIKALSPIRVA